MSKSSKSVKVSASVDGVSVPAVVVVQSAQDKYLSRGATIEPILGEKIRIQGTAMRASALEFGRLVLQASQIDEVVSFGLVNWLRYWGDCNASKSTVSNCLRLARSALACEKAGVAILGDRESRQLASDCKDASIDLQSATPAMIQSAVQTVVDSKEKAKAQAKAQAKAVASSTVESTIQSAPSAKSDPADFIKGWKADAMSFILTADDSQLQHLAQV